MTASPRCLSCGKPRTPRAGSPGCFTGAHGWCLPCCRRWYAAGRPEAGPPPALTRAECAALSNAATVAATEHRTAEYARLRGRGYSPAQAALRLGMGKYARLRAERAYRQAATREAAA